MLDCNRSFNSRFFILFSGPRQRSYPNPQSTNLLVSNRYADDQTSRRAEITEPTRTSARQYFHTDAADIVGLLCLHKAMEGGESDVVSAHHLWNTLQAERPDVAELLTKPNWYFDRKGEVSEGQKPWVQKAVSTIWSTEGM